MKLFKNGIELKYILLVIGILIISSVAIATTNPIIGDSVNYLDALNITRWVQATQFIDADNTTYYIDPSNTGTSIKTTGTVNFTSTSTESNIVLYTPTLKYNLQLDSNTGGLEINNNTAGNTALIIKGGITSDTDDIACIDPTTKELTKNTGSATTCAASSEKVKHAIKTKIPDNNIDKVRPVNFVYNDDKSERVRVGFIAEEFCVYYPEACYTGYQGNGTFVKVVVNTTTNKADGFLYSDGVIAPVKGIEPDYFVPTLTQIIQEQQFLIKTQAAQIRNICTNNPQLCS